MTPAPVLMPPAPQTLAVPPIASIAWTILCAWSLTTPSCSINLWFSVRNFQGRWWFSSACSRFWVAWAIFPSRSSRCGCLATWATISPVDSVAEPELITRQSDSGKNETGLYWNEWSRSFLVKTSGRWWTTTAASRPLGLAWAKRSHSRMSLNSWSGEAVIWDSCRYAPIYAWARAAEEPSPAFWGSWDEIFTSRWRKVFWVNSSQIVWTCCRNGDGWVLLFVWGVFEVFNATVTPIGKGTANAGCP